MFSTEKTSSSGPVSGSDEDDRFTRPGFSGFRLFRKMPETVRPTHGQHSAAAATSHRQMKNSQKPIIIIIFLVVIAVSPARAQVCGQYKTVLNILSVSGEPIEHAFVQLLPIGTDETKGRVFVRDERNLARFSIIFYEGHVLQNSYRLIVSAAGFKDSVGKIDFPYCRDRQVGISLAPFEQPNTATVSGQVTDRNGARIPGARIEAVNRMGERFAVRTDDSGSYRLDLPVYRNPKARTGIHIYRITFSGPSEHFEKEVFDYLNFKNSDRLDIKLDAVLHVRSPINHCDYSGGCFSEDLPPLEYPSFKLSNKVFQQPVVRFSGNKNNK